MGCFRYPLCLAYSPLVANSVSDGLSALCPGYLSLPRTPCPGTHIPYSLSARYVGSPRLADSSRIWTTCLGDMGGIHKLLSPHDAMSPSQLLALMYQGQSRYTIESVVTEWPFSRPPQRRANFWRAEDHRLVGHCEPFPPVFALSRPGFDHHCQVDILVPRSMCWMPAAIISSMADQGNGRYEALVSYVALRICPCRCFSHVLG